MFVLKPNLKFDGDRHILMLCQVLLGILQQRIELDKECMFQFTQLRKEVGIPFPTPITYIKLERSGESGGRADQHSTCPDALSKRLPTGQCSILSMVVFVPLMESSQTQLFSPVEGLSV